MPQRSPTGEGSERLTGTFRFYASFDVRPRRGRHPSKPGPATPSLQQAHTALRSVEDLFRVAWILGHDTDAVSLAAAYPRGLLFVSERHYPYPGGPYVEWLNVGSLEVVVEIGSAFAAVSGALTALVVLAERIFTFSDRVETEK